MRLGFRSLDLNIWSLKCKNAIPQHFILFKKKIHILEMKQESRFHFASWTWRQGNHLQGWNLVEVDNRAGDLIEYSGHWINVVLTLFFCAWVLKCSSFSSVNISDRLALQTQETSLLLPHFSGNTTSSLDTNGGDVSSAFKVLRSDLLVKLFFIWVSSVH